jgi:dihydropteroate synthase
MDLIAPILRLTDEVTWDWSRTYVFGVVNATPDSFSDGGMFAAPSQAIAHARQLADAGADALDVGGESTRPGAFPVSADEELARVIPVIRGIAQASNLPISIDTTKASVAREAMAAGATMINDISGFRLDPAMGQVAAETGAVVILGHLRGVPESMQAQIAFEDVVHEVCDELRRSVRTAIQAGVAPQRIMIDPGIGFGKTADQSLALIRQIGEIRQSVGYPIMVGPSRKSFIGQITGQPVGERVIGTVAAAAVAITAGVDAVRIHDVYELVPAIRVADGIRRGLSQPIERAAALGPGGIG